MKKDMRDPTWSGLRLATSDGQTVLDPIDEAMASAIAVLGLQPITPLPESK